MLPSSLVVVASNRVTVSRLDGDAYILDNGRFH